MDLGNNRLRPFGLNTSVLCRLRFFRVACLLVAGDTGNSDTLSFTALELDFVEWSKISAATKAGVASTMSLLDTFINSPEETRKVEM